jgi:[acyl-carrier-protein] S-malonyltransferase
MKTAFIFPGQGSQSQGMLDEFYSNFDFVKQNFELASNTLDYNLWDIIQNDKEKLNQTQYTQVAMLVAGVSCLSVLQNETDIVPEIIAGHSLGEITALVAGEVISFEDSVQIVNKRAELMQNAVPVGVGSMAAILGLDDEVIINTCKNYSGDGVVEAVNFNANGQVVIAGNTDAVAKTCEILKEKGAKRALVLPVSVPSHSSLMSSAGKDFADFLNDFTFNTPQTPILQNVDAQSIDDINIIKEKLAKQLYNPVLWVKTINNMADLGITQTIEVGPGKVLSGLNRRINKDIESKMIFDLATLNTIKG